MCRWVTIKLMTDSSTTPPLVEIRNLSFARGDRMIFDGIDMDIERGKVTAVMGPSGTGKTTLLRLIGGQIQPLTGTIKVDGIEVTKLSSSALFQLRKRMGMLFQNGALLTDMNVYDNVAFPIREHTQLSEKMVRTLVNMKLQVVGLRGAQKLMPSELSGGMSRRVAMARAIALDPMMMMYDEPFTGQDPISMGVLVRLIRELNDALGLSSIVVSHDIDEASSIADTIFLLSGGKVVAKGSADELRESGSEWAKQFMNGLPDGPVPFHYPAADYAEDLLSAGHK